jgi:hypothetical protein
MGEPPRNLLNHPLAEGVRKVGFRKWYERELLSSHAHMVLCVLCTVGLLGSFEAMRSGTPAERWLNVLFVLVCAAIGLWALRRYLALLLHAEEVANQANCAQCGEYGRLQVVDGGGHGTGVRCQRCGHRWTITIEP